jgi:hypothetical protein
MNRYSPAPLSAVLGALVGCAHMTSVENPGNHWLAVESENFRILTDGPPLHYKFLATRLENMHRAIKQAFFHQLETPRLDVLFITDEPLFMEVVDNVDLIAVFVSSVGRNGVLVIREGEEDETTAGLGVASHIVRFGIPRAPPWMHLGFASFLETAIVRQDGTAYFGQPPTGHAIEILEGRLLPLAQLEKATWDDMNGPENRRHYATAWAFIHYMAVGGTREVRRDLFKMLQVASSQKVPGVASLHITQYEEGFRDYALKTFGAKPSVKVFVEKLGALKEPALKVTPAPQAEVRELLQAVQSSRRK